MRKPVVLGGVVALVLCVLVLGWTRSGRSVNLGKLLEDAGVECVTAGPVTPATITSSRTVEEAVGEVTTVALSEIGLLCSIPEDMSPVEIHLGPGFVYVRPNQPGSDRDIAQLLLYPAGDFRASWEYCRGRAATLMGNSATAELERWWVTVEARSDRELFLQALGQTRRSLRDSGNDVVRALDAYAGLYYRHEKLRGEESGGFTHIRAGRNDVYVPNKLPEGDDWINAQVFDEAGRWVGVLRLRREADVDRAVHLAAGLRWERISPPKSPPPF